MDTRCRARYLWISRDIKVVVHIYYSRYLFKGSECPNELNLKNNNGKKFPLIIADGGSSAVAGQAGPSQSSRREF